MAEKFYNVVFRGKLKPGHTLEDVKQRLARLYKQDVGKIERKFFTGASVIVKANLDHQTAFKYQATLASRVGLLCEVEAVQSAPERPDTSKDDTTSAQTSSPKELHYNVVFYGEYAKDRELRLVKKNLIEFFKVPTTMIDSMFVGDRMVLKEELDHLSAERYKTDFQQTGAICRIELAGQEPGSSKTSAGITLASPGVKRSRSSGPGNPKKHEQPPTRRRRVVKPVMVVLLLGVLAIGGMGTYYLVALPTYTLHKIQQAVQEHDWDTFDQYVDSEQIIRQIFAELPELRKTKPGQAVVGGGITVMLLSEPEQSTALLKQCIKTGVEQGRIDLPLTAPLQQDGVRYLVRIFPLIPAKGVKVRRISRDWDGAAIVVVNVPFALYDETATLEFVMRREGWFDWRVTGIRNLYNYLVQVANMQQAFPYKNLWGTTAYLTRFIEEPGWSVSTELRIAFSLPESGYTELADDLVRRALMTVHTVEEPVQQSQAILECVFALREMQRFDEAVQVVQFAQSLKNPPPWARKRNPFILLETLVAAGRFDEVLDVIPSLGHDEQSLQTELSLMVSVGLQTAGDMERAHTIRQQALLLIDLMEESERKVDMYRHAAKILASSDPETSDRYFQQAVDRLPALKDSEWPTLNLSNAFADVGKFDQALELANSFTGEALLFTKMAALAYIVNRMAEQKQFDHVRSVIASIPHETLQKDRRSAQQFAPALAAAGEVEQALKLAGDNLWILCETATIIAAKPEQVDLALEVAGRITQRMLKMVALTQISLQLASLQLDQSQQAAFARKIMVEGAQMPVPTAFTPRPVRDVDVETARDTSRKNTAASNALEKQVPEDLRNDVLTALDFFEPITVEMALIFNIWTGDKEWLEGFLIPHGYLEGERNRKGEMIYSTVTSKLHTATVKDRIDLSFTVADRVFKSIDYVNQWEEVPYKFFSFKFSYVFEPQYPELPILGPFQGIGVARWNPATGEWEPCSSHSYRCSLRDDEVDEYNDFLEKQAMQYRRKAQN